jgi:hypothetical protein
VWRSVLVPRTDWNIPNGEGTRTQYQASVNVEGTLGIHRPSHLRDNSGIRKSSTHYGGLIQHAA